MFTQLLICGVAIWILNVDVTTGINEDAFLLISSNDGELWILTVDGQEQRKIPNEFPYITKVAYDKSDHVIYYITFDWSSTNSKSNVYKVSMDGDVDFVFSTRDITQDFDLSDMVIDDGYIYLCGFGIYRVKTDGTNLETLTNDFAQGISVNSKDGYLIWTSFSESIYRSYISHATLRETLVTDIDDPGYIHVDYDSSKMYWCAYGTGKVQEANIDGTDRKTVVEIPNVDLQHMTGHNGHLYITSLLSSVFDIDIQQHSYTQIVVRSTFSFSAEDIALVRGNITDTGLFGGISENTQPSNTINQNESNKTDNPKVLTSLNIGLLVGGIVLIIGIITSVITTALVLHRRNHADKKPNIDSVSSTGSIYDEPNPQPGNSNVGIENYYEVIDDVISKMENVTSSQTNEEPVKNTDIQLGPHEGNRSGDKEMAGNTDTYMEPVKNTDIQLGPHEGNRSGYLEMAGNTNAYVEPVKNTDIQLRPNEGNRSGYKEMAGNTDTYVEPVQNTETQLGPQQGNRSGYLEMAGSTNAYVNTDTQLGPHEGNRPGDEAMTGNTDTYVNEPAKNTDTQLRPHEGNIPGDVEMAGDTNTYVEPVKSTDMQLDLMEGNSYDYEEMADNTDEYVKLTDPQCEKIDQIPNIYYVNTSIHQPVEKSTDDDIQDI